MFFGLRADNDGLKPGNPFPGAACFSAGEPDPFVVILVFFPDGGAGRERPDRFGRRAGDPGSKRKIPMNMNPYAWSLVGAALVSAAVGGYVWRHRASTRARAFPLLMFSLAWWSFAYGMEVASTAPGVTAFWGIVEYPGIASSPVLWLIFTLGYAGKSRRLSRPLLVGLFLVPLITVTLVATNTWHHLFYRSTALDSSGAFPLLALTPGPGYWLHVVYSYVCLLAGTMLLFSVWVRSSHLYRRQAGIMLLGASVPFASNVLYMSGIRPSGHLDLTPFAFTVTGLVVAFGLFRYRLFDLMPLAHGVLLENLREGIAVLDGEQRVVEMNPAARRMVGTDGRPFVGLHASRVFADHPALVDLICNGSEAEREVELYDPARVLEARYSPLVEDGEASVGGLLALRDVTAAKQAERTLRKGHERLELLLHAMPQAILVIEAKTHRIVDANPQACLLIGLPPDRIVGRRCHSFVCRSREGDCPITNGGKHLDRSESVLVTAEGEEIPVLKTVLAIDVDGEEWLIESISDITELKRAELERLEKEKLQALVETAGAVCHEMNQPLMGISGYGELALMELDAGHPVRPEIEKVLEQVGRMTEITRKLMRITNYRTKAYLSGKILDIDSSTQVDEGDTTF